VTNYIFRKESIQVGFTGVILSLLLFNPDTN